MRSCPSCGTELNDQTSFCISCGLRVETAAPAGESTDAGLSPGRIVDGKYRVERVLGEGGMGVVYLARSIHTDSEVVIKAVRPEIAHRKDIRDRTLAEGKALARIDHPNVVQLKSVVVSDDELLLVMQYIEGETLEDRIRHSMARGGPLPFGEALRIFQQVLAGVAAAHVEGVIHRDLKPANVLIRRKDGVTKVTDFGIAKPEEEERDRSQTKGIIGSVHYMSPEQVKGQRDVDRRADIYALGIVLYQMLTGRVPFDADNSFEIMRQQIEAPLPSISTLRPDLSPALDGILQRACAKDREHRFGDCDAFSQALAAIEPTQLGTDPAMRAPGPTLPAAPVLATAEMPLGVAATVATESGYVPPVHAAGTITGQAAELPPSTTGSSKAWLWGLAGAAALASVATVLVITGVVPLGGGAVDPVDVEPSATPPVAPQPSVTTSTSSANVLETYQGRWVSDSGRQLDAVLIGERLELQVVDPAQFPEQPYVAGEARFVLHPMADEEGVFSVEDRVRPRPPAGYRYTAAARLTCLAAWKIAGGKPLHAEIHGDRLDVELAKIEPTAANFDRVGREVVSCRGLESLSATRLPQVLRRR